MAIPLRMKFVSVTSPIGVDSQDGFDVFALGSTGDTWTHSTLTFTKTTHGLTPGAGQIFYVSSASAGNAGWYTVASFTTNTIVMTALVAGVDIGSDQTDIVTSTGAYLTIDKAITTGVAVAGDKIFVRSGTDYSEDAVIDVAGTQAAQIIVEGYTTTPGDNGQATMSGTTSCLTTTLGAGTNTYTVFKNFIFTGCSGAGVSLANCRSMTFKRCTAHGNSGSGFFVPNTGASFELCTSHTNGSVTSDHGFHATTSAAFVGCSAYGNSGNGLIFAQAIVYGCEVYNNGTSGTKLAQIKTSDATGNVIIGCTGDGNSVNNTLGIWFAGSPRSLTAVNNIIYNCDGTSGVGMEWGVDLGEVAISRNNLANSNTLNYVLADTFSGEVTGAPDFGTGYKLNSSSPAKAAGTDAGDVVNDVSYVDIGAHQRQEPVIAKKLIGGGLAG